MRKNKNIVMSLFICLVIVLSLLSGIKYALAKEQERVEIKNVLIINSYHQGFSWTKDEVDGIIETLLESGSNINIRVEYMDWKNNPTQENIDYLYDYYKYKYQHKNIDAIITTDDVALQFALDNREELFTNAPVVFCGVNQDGVENLTEGYNDVTGVIEVIDPTKTIEIALDINPSLKKIYLIYDNSESGQSTGRIVTEKIEALNRNLKVIPCNNMIYENILSTARSLENDSIILITTYYSDVENNIIELDFLTEEISTNSNVPVYHLYDFALDKGTMGGDLLSGRLQGEYAAGLAIRILQGEDINKIPVTVEKSTRTVFDYQQMRRFDISMKDIPMNSEIINKPFSFYETYRDLVNIVISAFIALIIFVCILLFYIRKIARMRKNLSDSHAELTQIYEELSASDEEVKQQYAEILKMNEKLRLGEEKLTFLAYHDALTGLPNKISLYKIAKRLFQKDKGKTALFFIDIDNFKYVNDTLGHAFGDLLIKKVSKRLTSLLENNFSLYRISGDEFILILEDINNINYAEEYASNILSKFTKKFSIQKTTLYVSLSIGVVMFPDHGKDLEQLLKFADIAMYRAKEAGKNNYVVFDQYMNQVLSERVEIEKHLHNALENNEFEVYYQPQYDIITRRITGIEALLRWNSPYLGSVSPLKFIKVAEDTRIIIPIGTWVLKQACTFAKKLNDMGFEDLTVSVNVSVLQLLQMDFCEIVENTLNTIQLKPENLELEITETVLIESYDSLITRLEQLRDRKVRIAIDDFGTGYSSLNYLKQLPISTLKVDKSFVDDILDENTRLLTKHIVNIGKSMDICVVAEGVEKQEQLEYLIQNGCDKFQGYLYSKPVPETKLVNLLKDNRNNA